MQQEDNRNNKLMTVDDAAAALDMLRRDYGYGRGGAAEAEETHLRDYWRVIRRRLWVPISVVILAVTLTTIYNLRLPSIFEGITKIIVEREDRVVNLNDLQINMGGGDDTQYINTQLKILQSPKIAYLVVKTLDLEHNPAFLPISKEQQASASQLQISDGESEEKTEMQRLIRYTDVLLGSVEVRPVRDTRLVEIHYQHQDKDLARKIADTWADVFIKNNRDTRYEANKESGEFLERSIADYRLKLREAEEKLQNYRVANQVLDFGEKENIVGARLASLNQLLLTAETERKTLQTAYELSKSVSDPRVLPEIQRDALVQDLNKRRIDLQQRREHLLVEYTEEWPEVQKVNHELSQVEGELRAAHLRLLSGLENQYKSAVEKENQLRTAFAQQRAETMQQNEGAINAKMLQQEVDTNRQMLDKLLQSQSNVEITAAGLIKPNLRVTEYSPVPRVPVAPKRAQNILISLLLGLIGGLGLVLFLDYINNKVESVEDIDRYLKLPALGVIPIFEQPKSRKALLSGESETSEELVPVNRGNDGNVILTQVEANSSIAESYRQLRTSLLLSSAGHAPRTLLITSSQPAEGKTTTSVNTAISLAQTGSAVLIVDADLRRPRVHKIFGLKNNAGLCNYLAGDCDLASLIQIAMPNLYVLPVGPLPPNPAELLGSTKMKQVVETLAANFDYVIIDSPPVSSFADSLILSALVEGVIIVIRSGFTPREMAQRTKAHLQSVGAKILGVVINQIKLQPHDYYYYSTYYSRYYYGTGDGENKASAEKDD
jgi:succinoglycan biosynthesis transport protein ExoP